MNKKMYYRLISFFMILIFVLSFGSIDSRAESSDYTIVVNVTQNVVTVYQGGQPVKAMTCSTGTYTPRSGTYRTSDKYTWHYLVGGVSGQYCTRITGQILFHSVPYTRFGDNSSLEYWEYDKLGTSASLGCVRLCVEDAKWLYDNCARGTSVTFVTDDTMPLGKPSTYKVSSMPDEFKGWDPTDPADNNPWRIYADSACFDARYYADNNPDVKAAFGYDEKMLLNHWIRNGIREGRKASKEFDVRYYKSTYADLRAAFGDDNYAYVRHYINNGKREKRKGSENNINESEVEDLIYNGLSYVPIYDYNYYITRYKDIYNAFGDDKEAVFNHFINYGMKEGRQASENFNIKIYKNNYPDLQKAFGDDLKKYYIHYLTNGIKEKRKATVAIGTGTASNASATTVPTQTQTTESTGKLTVKDGIDYSPVYDYDYYIAHNKDVYNAFGDNQEAVLNHFITYGMKEGRIAKETFNVKVYKENYVDLRNAFGDNTKSYYMHYITHGINEYRKCY